MTPDKLRDAVEKAVKEGFQQEFTAKGIIDRILAAVEPLMAELMTERDQLRRGLVDEREDLRVEHAEVVARLTAQLANAKTSAAAEEEQLSASWKATLNAEIERLDRQLAESQTVIADLRSFHAGATEEADKAKVIMHLRAQLQEAKRDVYTEENVEVAAAAIWRQHMNKLDSEEQTSWEDAPPLGRGITLAYAKNALLAIDAAKGGTT